MDARVPKAAAQRALASIMREDADQVATGKRLVIKKGTDGQLPAFLEPRATSFRKRHKGETLTVDKLVDAAMPVAMRTWNKFNTKGKRWLSQDEIKKIGVADPALGALMPRVRQRVLDLIPTKEPVLIPVVSLEGAPAGITLAQDGDLFTISAKGSVPAGAKFQLVVDGKPYELFRGPMGINIGGLEMPLGLGFAEVERQRDDATKDVGITLRIRRDAPGSLTQEHALAKAQASLVTYFKTDFTQSDEWKSNIGITWEEAVEDGILEHIAKFAVPVLPGDEENFVERKLDSYTFVGRVLGLHTEVDVRKQDGAILRTYVELD